jgi:hypothetical protein
MFPFKKLFPHMLYPTYEDGDVRRPKRHCVCANTEDWYSCDKDCGGKAALDNLTDDPGPD